MTRREPTPWQHKMLADLDVVARSYPSEVRLAGAHRLVAGGAMRLRLRLRTGDFVGGPGGVTLRDSEEFVVTVGPSCLVPPWAEVDHLRFLGHVHVLMGRHLCLYLDPSREWDPHRGFGGFLDRLRDWP